MNITACLSSKSNEWQTPKSLFDFYNKRYNFVLDAAATKENALCDNYYTKEDDALKQDWGKFGRTVWLNPPYGREIGKFVRKAHDEAKSKDLIVVCCIPSRTDTKYWRDCVLNSACVDFIAGRLKFTNVFLPSYQGVENSCYPAPFPSCVVTFCKRSFLKVGSLSQNEKGDWNVLDVR